MISIVNLLIFSILSLNAGNVPLHVFFDENSFNFDNIEKDVIIENNEEEVSIDKTVLKKKIDDFKPIYFDLQNSSGAIFDLDNDEFVFEKKATDIVKIASITKLMTALVFLDNNPKWDYMYKMSRADRRNGGKIILYLGEVVKLRDIFHTSLIASANTATMALISSIGLTEDEFVNKMNQKALKMGLLNTYFADPVGLSEENVSTARDVARLAQEAFQNQDIVRILSKNKYEFLTKGGKLKKIESTNKLLNIVDDGVINAVGKTGYIESAGYCFVGKFVKDDKEIISVILGAKDNEQRFSQSMNLSKLYLKIKYEK